MAKSARPDTWHETRKIKKGHFLIKCAAKCLNSVRKLILKPILEIRAGHLTLHKAAEALESCL